MKSVVVSGKCFRIGCTASGSRAVRSREGKLISFCPQCFRELVRSNVIDKYTGRVLTD
ncbi:MAG: hypothetical protein ACRD8W_13525 [Nitrososphaeraceae archaeon]